MDSLSVIVTFIIVLVFSEFCIDTVERLCSVATINYRLKKGAKPIGIQHGKSFFK